MRHHILAFLSLVTAISANAATIRVPQDQPTIQTGINAAIDGDTVLVADGVYHERISFYDKSIVVASHILLDGDIAHIQNTVIDGDSAGLPATDTGSVVRVIGNHLNTPALRGFTIRNGQPLPIVYGPIGGSGIFVTAAYKTLVSDCVFDHNDAAIDYRDAVFERCDFVGAGVNNIRTAAIRLKNCSVDDTLKSWSTPGGNAGTFYIDSSIVNDVQCYGRGRLESTHSTFIGSIVYERESSLHISHCEVHGFVNPGQEGRIHADHTDFSGVINARSGCEVFLDKCLVRSGLNVSGVTPSGPAVALRGCTLLGGITNRLFYAHVVIDSSILILESPIDIESAWLTLHCSDIVVPGSVPWVGTTQVLDTSGVIFSDPHFCDPASGDYRIKDTSPCAPANNSCGVLIGAFAIGCYTGDLDGDEMLSLSDAVFLINYIFNHGSVPAPDVSADLNCDGKVNITDAVFLINHLFQDGSPPCEP